MKIFISYSRKDIVIVKLLVNDLKSLGYTIWLDQELSGGKKWWDHILLNIQNCDLFVFVLSKNGIMSTPCSLEYKYAHRLNKNILPILISNDAKINLLPVELSSIQFVDYRKQNKQAAFKLLESIRNLPPVSPLPNPLPISPEVPVSYLGNLRDEVISTDTLSFQAQSALVLKLKDQLRNSSEKSEAIFLLSELRKRDDLYARIAWEIDQYLNDKQYKGSIGSQDFRANIARAAKKEWSSLSDKTLKANSSFKIKHWIYGAVMLILIITLIYLVNETNGFRTSLWPEPSTYPPVGEPLD